MYFLDTYAMIEYFRDNKAYVDLIRNNQFQTSDFQLMELYYAGLKEQGEELAEKYFEVFSLVKTEISEKTLKNAMKTRLRLQKQEKLNVSYIDAVGYQHAIENKQKFVTGDSAFKNFDSQSVLYIK